MALTTEHIPLPCSLWEPVSRDFAPQDHQSSDRALSAIEIVQFLAKSKDTDGSPLATIKRRAAKQNRAAELTADDHATLAWVCEAFEDWEENYPLEPPLRDKVRRLLPLAVAMALTDSAFFTPGAHPLHRLLDTLQSGAVGWQQRLDRAGQMLEQRVERSIDKALEWFANDRTDIAAITREFESANDRDSARAQRMVQRLAETEEARLKTLTAKRQAALMINEGLNAMTLPAAIGEFLKGPWYDSAQLVLVKFGDRSREWQQIERATKHLMESVQPPSEAGEAERDRQEQILRHLPGDLRRWLLSLEHDSDATDSAIGLVEYAHLRVQHGQQLQLVRIDPIAVESEESAAEELDEHEYESGNWYRFEDDEGELRAQLVLQLDRAQHLLFANFVGLKALDLSRRAFSMRLKDGFAAALPHRDTFSISLAAAAGIDTEDKLRQLLDPTYTPPSEEPEPAPEPAPTMDPSASPTESLAPSLAPSPAPEAQIPDLHVEPIPSGADQYVESPPSGSDGDQYDPVLTPPPGAEIEPVLAPPTGAEVEAPLSPNQAADVEPVLTPPSGAEIDPMLTPQAGAEIDPVLTPPAGAEIEPALASTQAADVDPVLIPPAGAEVDLPLELDEPPEPAAATATPVTTTPMPGTTPTPAPSIATAPPPVPAPPVAEPPLSPATPTAPSQASAPATPSAPPAAAESSTREVDVPMGAWLGFHDGEMPIMAKLAVYDPRRDNYIFVNRKGIALRELNRAELLALMDQGLVDILETRCYFRDEVERARGEDQ